MCVNVLAAYLYMPCLCPWCLWMLKGVSDLLGLELKMVMSHLCVLGIKPSIIKGKEITVAFYRGQSKSWPCGIVCFVASRPFLPAYSLLSGVRK